MSGVGKKPVAILTGVEIKFTDPVLLVSGPKGKLVKNIDPLIKVKIVDGKITFERSGNDKNNKALQGLYRAVALKMMKGVTEGFEKKLELSGVGYRASLMGKNLSLNLGFSHPVEVNPPDGITFAVEGQNKIKVSGINWEMVGQVAANIRAIMEVEPYKGKGIKYQGEFIKKKAGKAAKAIGAGT